MTSMSWVYPIAANSADRAALMAFHEATGGDGHVKADWLSDRPLDQWHGARVERRGTCIHRRAHPSRPVGELAHRGTAAITGRPCGD